MKDLKPNAQRGKAAIAMISIILILNLIIAILEAIQLLSQKNIISEDAASENLVFLLDSALLYSLLISLTAITISAVTFIRWFRRAYYNLGAMIGRTEYSDWWTAGAWFIPLVNLYIPFKIMLELYEKTDQYIIAENKASLFEKLKSSYIKWWWALSIMSVAIGYFTLKLEYSSIFISYTESTIFLSIINSILSIILGLITIIIIEDYSKTEKILYNMRYEEADTPHNPSV